MDNELARAYSTPQLGDIVKAGEFRSSSWFVGEVVEILGIHFAARDWKGNRRSFDTEHATEYRLTGNVNDEARDADLSAQSKTA